MRLTKSNIRVALATSILLGGAAAALAQRTPGYNNKIPESILTPDHVETPIGDLNFFDGMPDEATVQKLYDNLLFMRGVEAFLSGIPATSIEAIRLGNAEIGAKRANHVVIFDKLMDSDPLFLTGNTDTVYATGILELDRDGPTVVVIPPKSGPGTLNDAWQRFVVDKVQHSKRVSPYATASGLTSMICPNNASNPSRA